MRLSRTSLAAVLCCTAACTAARDNGSSATSDVTGGITLRPAISAPSASGPSYGNQAGPVVVAGANQYLAAWTEQRIATKQTGVWFTRLGPDGAILDDQSLPIATSVAAGADAGSVALAFDGTSYLVVWTQKSGTGGMVYGARVGADGHVLDAVPFQLGRGTDGVSLPSVAHGDGGYLVTWQDDRDKGPTADAYSSDVYGARISSAGVVVGGSEGFRISSAPGFLADRPSVAAVGDTFLVAYGKKAGDRTSTHAVRVSNTGAIVDSTPLAFGDDSASPSVAADGTQFFVAWLDVANGAKTIAATRVAKDGTKTDATPIAIASTNPGAPAVAWDGDGFAVAWSHGAQRVGANGQKLGAVLPGGHGALADVRPGVAGSGGALLVLHTEDATHLGTASTTAYAAATLFAKSDGTAIESDLAIARGPATQRGIVTAGHGTSSLSLWLDYRTDWGHPAIYAAGFGADGTLGAPVQLDPGTTAKNALPAVVYDGSGYTVAWESRTGTTASSVVAHVNDQGVVSGTPKTFAGGAPQLTIGSNDRVILTTDGLHGYFLDSTSPFFTRGPDAAGTTIGAVTAPIWAGSRIVLAWSQTKGDGKAEIYTQRFDLSGGAEPPAKVTSFDLAGDALPALALSTGRDRSLLVWEEHGAIKGGRIGTSGLTDTAIRLDPAPAGTLAYAPRLAWDGIQWVLAYEARTDKGPSLDGSALGLTRVRIGTNGLVPDPAAQALSPRGLRPFVLGGTTGNTFVGFESLDTGPGAAPRATFSYFSDTTGTNSGSSTSSSSSSGGGTTAGDDDDDGRPASGDDDDAPVTAPKKPAVPAPATAKGATIKGGPSAGSAGDDGGGCAVSTSRRVDGSNAATGAFWLVALVGGSLARRRSRVPHARR